MKTTEHINRYNDKFTFTDLENGNVLWEGNFKYCRFGMPNDYTAAYAKYQEDGGEMSLDEFKEKVHEYDTENSEYKMGRELVSLIGSKTNEIDMVDPSGGPYLARGGKIHEKTIKEFKVHPKGYEIVVYKEGE